MFKWLFGPKDCSKGHEKPHETIQDKETGLLNILGICPRCKEVVGASLIGLEEMQWCGLKYPNGELAKRVRQRLEKN